MKLKMFKYLMLLIVIIIMSTLYLNKTRKHPQYIVVTNPGISSKTEKIINIKLTGIQFRDGDTEYSEEKTIEIKGVFKTKECVFNGTINFEGYKLPGYTLPKAVVCNYWGKNSNGKTIMFSMLVYIKPVERDVFENVGIIYFDEEFNNVLIEIYEKETDENGNINDSLKGLTFCAPAEDRTEAVRSAKKLTEGISDIVWK